MDALSGLARFTPGIDAPAQPNTRPRPNPAPPAASEVRVMISPLREST